MLELVEGFRQPQCFFFPGASGLEKQPPPPPCCQQASVNY